MSTAIATPALAQVDVEPLRRQLKDDGAALRLNASFAGYLGNTDALVVGGSSLTGGRFDRHFGYLSANGDFAQFDSEVTVARYFVHLRYNLELASFLWGEAFAQIESDRFRKIRARELVGIGPRFALARSQSFDVHAGTSYMPEWTQFDDGSERFAHRWSNYLALTWSPDERVTGSHTTYFQPRIDDFGDFKLLSVSSLGFEITPLLESKVSLSVRHESRPLAGVERTDLEVKNSLGVVLD